MEYAGGARGNVSDGHLGVWHHRAARVGYHAQNGPRGCRLPKNLRGEAKEPAKTQNNAKQHVKPGFAHDFPPVMGGSFAGILLSFRIAEKQFIIASFGAKR
jgi:hypothetical protein